MKVVPQDSQCLRCVHFKGWVQDRDDNGIYDETTERVVCAAFERGIPSPILHNMEDHREPIEGDQGIQWEPTEDDVPHPLGDRDKDYVYKWKSPQIDLIVTEGMIEEAKRGLAWREEFNRGGTRIGVARANQIIRDKKLTPETWRRVKAYFDRHQVDEEGQGWNRDEDGYPSAGRIAWALWGGDPGWARAKKIVEKLNSEED